MQLFPLYANFKNKTVVVIGGGDVAARKVQLLLRADACVYVIAPSISNALMALARENQITVIKQPFAPAHLDDAWFVVAATSHADINALVAREATARRLFVNVVDDPALSSVQVPAIVDRSPLVISISSTGTAPMIARHVREQIETLVDSAMGQLATLAQTYREHIRQQHPCMRTRRQFYEWLIHGPVLQHLRDGHETTATQCLEQALSQNTKALAGHTVEISIPGDNPGDITLHTLRTLNQADTIFHDERISPKVLDLARRDANRCSYAPIPHATRSNVPVPIHQRLAHLAQNGSVNVLLTRPGGHTARPHQNRIPDTAHNLADQATIHS